MLGTDLAGLDRLALSASAGAGGLVLLPYLEGERTPNLSDAAGTLTGLRRTNMTAENVARAAVEGMLCGLADGIAALCALGVETRRVLLIGGAARQAAWALAGTDQPPHWEVAAPEPHDDVAAPDLHDDVHDDMDAEAGERVRAGYATARATIHPSSV